MDADKEWMIRRFGLPEEAFPVVEQLRRQEQEGSTACRLLRHPKDWGKAAVAAGEKGDTPLIWQHFAGVDWLQSRAMYEAEVEIAAKLSALRTTGESIQKPMTKEEKKALFPKQGSDDDGQYRAAAKALESPLAIITGGPGTGKTHTLARVLALYARRGWEAGQVRLAAPTGKAADQMKRAVLGSLPGLPERFSSQRDKLAAIAEESGTLHRLLGYNPKSGRSRYGPDNPFPFSLLIIDECSMIDIYLWRAVLRALPEGGRLLLLGDPNQLESVGQGNIFRELSLLSQEDGPLGKVRVHLRESWRFRERPGIGKLARAMEEGRADEAVDLLQASREAEGDTGGGIRWVGEVEGTFSVEHLPESLQKRLEALADAPTPQDALEAQKKICLLTAQRHYTGGSRNMGEIFQEWFEQQGKIRNYPILIQRNCPETGLRNGTPGILNRGEEGKLTAWFSQGEEIRSFHPAVLPEYELAWAMTIHRSQGSEYDEVVVLLPHQESPLMGRSLLYTAITRARRQVTIFGSLDAVREAVGKESRRQTLLAAAFGVKGEDGA